jgi:BirA family transcriptional regulator, biotin operon repressor / biotin---[acetyl-CoA-carboxylase] ligase
MGETSQKACLDLTMTHPDLENFFYHQSLPSTMDEARKLALLDTPEWSVVLAETQSAGRGRRGKVWRSAPHSGLYFTVVLYPRLEPRYLGLLPLLVGASLAKTILTSTGIETHLKWSNDLLCPDGRKFGGILLEQTGAAVLLGVGINVAQQDFPPDLNAAALEEFTPIRRWDLLETIVGDLKLEYQRFLEQPDHALGLWKAQPNTLGRSVKILEPDGTTWQGVALDLDKSGGLLVQVGEQTKIVYAAEVSLRHSPNL